MQKRIKYLGVLLLVMFLNVVYVNAALPQTLGPIKQVGNEVTITGSSGLHYGMTLKVSSSNPVICTDFGEKSPVEISATCDINSDWDEKIRYAIAAVIKESKSKISLSEVNDDYFAANLAVNKFLNEKELGGYDVVEEILSGNVKTLYLQYKNIANNAYAGYVTASNTTIQISETELTFVINGDNYESNVFSVINVSDFDSYDVKSSVGSVVKLDNSFKIVVPVKDVEKTTQVIVTITVTKSIEQARNYDCGEGYQTITPYEVETVEKKATKEISGTIVPKPKVVISKLDASGKNELAGATLEIQDEKGNIVKFCVDKEGNKNTECKWVSTNKPYEIEDFPAGKYYLVETIAPKGYELNKEKIQFEVKEGVVVTKVVMENQLEVEVPDTLKSRSVILLVGAMVTIALGVGLIVYAKNKKIKE